MRLLPHRTLALALALAVPPSAAHAQWIGTYEQSYLQAPHNWRFRENFPAADRLFNAFDYGHAILSETLWARPEDGPGALEVDAYGFLTGTLLVSPPRLPLAERAIAPRFSQLAPEIMAMFGWAHLLHRQVYDVLADESMAPAAQDAEIARLVRYYRSRSDLAFSSRPKSMALMQEQPYSLTFRQRYPKFNGLIWAYHWLQMGLYEPLVTGRTREAKQAGVAEALARFRLMLLVPPASLPYVMPMSPAIAPAFTARFPELAIIFDNLHSLHDVVSDILANPVVPRDDKRSVLMTAAAAYRDDSTEVMTVVAWKRMAGMMGLENMGGAVLGQMGALPKPTVVRGAVMRHDRDGNMIGEHAGHVMPAGEPAAPVAAATGAKPLAADTTRVAAESHAGHVMPAVSDTAKPARQSTAAPQPAAPPVAPAAMSHEKMDHAAHMASMKEAAAKSAADSAFAALQARGAKTMGVNQYSSQHVFEDLRDGGRIVLERDPTDTAGVATIRAHLREIAAAFAGGDFTTPFATHAQEVPGTKVMSARRRTLRYSMRERPGGGEVRITTTDPASLKAVRAFLDFQRRDHRAPAKAPSHEHPPGGN